MTSPELRKLFSDPPPTFGPTPLWWWSGGEVTSERMRWQLQRFAEGGITNLVVINLAPAGPIFAARADVPAWFSEPWWDRFTETCEIAAELGTKIWFYDQIGFSGANLQGSITHAHPEASGSGLRHRFATVERGVVALQGQERLVALYAATPPGGRAERLEPGRLPPDGTTVEVVTAVPTAFDYLEPTAVERLVDLVHHEFDRRVPEHLGTVVVGSFQDELPATGTWTGRFADEFRARRGYDLLDHLPALWSGDDDASAKVRGDYGWVRSELAEEAFFRPLADWHAERGMLLGCDQFNPARAGFPTQSTQLYADYFRTHRWYSAAGSDHEGDARVHSSMAHLYGHPRVWIESFHSSGWGGTLEDVYDWLLPFLRSGANLYNPHATYFGTAGGWFEWAPPSTDWRQPYWRHYPEFSQTVARLCSLLSWGSHEADVAVLHPTATVQALLPLDAPVEHFGDGQVGGPYAAVDETQDHYLQLCGTNNWFDTRVGLLDAAGVSFDVVDDDSLHRSTLSTDTIGAGLAIRDHCFRTVVLPSTDVLETRTAERLCELLDAGGRVVVVGRPPRLAAGRDGDDGAVRRLREHSALHRVPDPAGVVDVLAHREPHVAGDVPLLVRRSGRDGLALVTGAFPNASAYPLRRETWKWDDHDFDPARYAAIQTVTVPAPVVVAEVWNPATGSQRPVPVVRTEAGSRIDVPLDGAPAVLLVWREGDPTGTSTDADEDAAPVAVGPGALAGSTTDLGAGWTGELVPTLDNTWGDLALPVGDALTELQMWTLDWTEDASAAPDGSGWTPVTVTSGQAAAVLAPVAAADRPAPLSVGAAAAVRRGDRTLLEPGFVVHTWSGSRGLPKDGGILGTKGMVAEEFLRVPAPAVGEMAVLRSLVRTNFEGPTDLLVGAAATRRVWWNGVEVPTGSGYLSTISVDAAGVNLLEVELGAAETHPGFDFSGEGDLLGCFVALARPGSFGARPQFMTVGDGVVPTGRVSYRNRLEVPPGAGEARLVVGAATGLSILVDGTDVARQEKVEYYEASWGATPMYFSHDLTGTLTPGEHVVEIVTESTDARDVVFVDLVVTAGDQVVTLVSGPGWETGADRASAPSQEHRGRWSNLAAAHAAERSHPLPEAAWLHGPPVVGEPVDDVAFSVSAAPAVQRFRVRLPAGTTGVTLPLRGSGTVELLGRPLEVRDGAVRLPEPVAAVTDLIVETGPRAFDRGGAAWHGPLLVSTARAPIELGSWRDVGLRAWSGAVRYAREVDVPAGSGSVVLDLGRVRGSVDVRVDGRQVGSAFCAPYRFELPALGRTATVEVTVYNTLAPFLDESTPTVWVFPSQLQSGLLGPVTLTSPAASG
ncbi:hypothetical protein GCM10022197_12350 [Microlunatus spumicola]|uniref:Alpha-L-rhamnosidase n=1 Tax=Microlunatus spumicola TaxID=81499 RepID=A0ABP6X0R7_9ACTN